ncbi:MAG: CARDB domain-containing protein [bacterium]|nr:CARDB domain-containing protein [bacterium]
MIRHITFQKGRTLLLAGFFLVIPLVTLASFDGPFPTISAINLKATVQIGGQPVKSPALVGANSNFTINWTAVDGARCVSNWSDSSLPAKGSSAGSITTSRSFVITCYAPGAAQTARLQVNVGTTDLLVSSFSASGLKVSRKKGFYVAGPFILKASVRNAGKLGTSLPVRVRFEESQNGTTGWVASGESVISRVNGNGTVQIEPLSRVGNAGVDTRYYRVCVDTERKVDESNETNNCSKSIGPYSFIAPTS